MTFTAFAGRFIEWKQCLPRPALRSTVSYQNKTVDANLCRNADSRRPKDTDRGWRPRQALIRGKGKLAQLRHRSVRYGNANLAY